MALKPISLEELRRRNEQSRAEAAQRRGNTTQTQSTPKKP